MNKKVLFALLGIWASLVLITPAFAPQTYLTYFLLPSGLGSPPAGVLLRNPTQENATVTLKAFNEQGDLLGQTLITLGPSESKALFPGDDQGELPKETATVQAESDVPLAGFVVFGSLEAPLEILPASGAVSHMLDFPYLGRDDSWTIYLLFNPNASSVPVTFRAFDKDGALLAEVPIVPLSPQEARTVPIEELFDSSLLPFVATVRAIADSPITGSELTGSFQGEDVAALAGLSSLSSVAGPVPGLSLLWPVGDDNRANLGQDYAQYNDNPKRPNHYHTGLDIKAPEGTAIYAAADGYVEAVCPNVAGGCVFGGKTFAPRYTRDNNGLQGVVLLRHLLPDEKNVYSLYAHLGGDDPKSGIANGVFTGFTPSQFVKAGTLLGITNELNHVHFEIKDAPVLYNPIQLSNSCIDPRSGKPSARCWGYVLNHPDQYGYHDPILNLHYVDVASGRVQITENGVNLRVGPGGSGTTEYRAFNTVNAGEEYDALGSSGGTSTPDCLEGWYQIRRTDGDCSITGNCFDDTSPGHEGSSIPDGWVCAKFVEVISGGAPTITSIVPFCDGTTSQASITFSGTPGDFGGFYVDIDRDGNWDNGFFNRFVPATTTGTHTIPDAPAGFQPVFGESGTLTFTSGSTYWVRVYNGQHSDTQEFTSDCGEDTPPTATTGSATNVTSSSATLNGTVNPNGSSTTAYFQWGSTTSYGNSTSSQSIGSGTSNVSVSASLSGLTANTAYHFRVVASNSAGTTYGADGSFTTSPPPGSAPTATTGSATNVTSSSATLNGTVNPNGLSTTAYFQWGSTTSYGNTTSSQSIGSGTSSLSVSANLSGLSPNTTYHYRVVASNSAGTTYGADVSFTTQGIPPGFFTLTATAECSGNNTPQIRLTWTPASGVDFYQVYRNGNLLEGLTATTYLDTAVTVGTTYRYYVLAFNSGGETKSNEITVTARCDTPPGAFTLTVVPWCENNAPVNQLTWTGSAGRTLPYEIYRDGNQIATIEVGGYDDTAVTAGTTYAYWVVARNSVGSTSSNTETKTARTDCVAPQAPVIDSISPQTVTVGSGGFTLTITGHDFDPNAYIMRGFEDPPGSWITPTSRSSTTLTYQVNQQSWGFEAFEDVGVYFIQVLNPYPSFWDGQRSNTVQFPVFNPVPVVNSISGTCRATSNCTPSNGYDVKINGSGFVGNITHTASGTISSTYAEINGNSTPVDLLGQRPVSSQMQLYVNGSLIPTPGTYSIKVCNAGTAQGTSCSTGSLTVTP